MTHLKMLTEYIKETGQNLSISGKRGGGLERTAERDCLIVQDGPCVWIVDLLAPLALQEFGALDASALLSAELPASELVWTRNDEAAPARAAP